jgi:hypothetical protein
MPSRHLRTLWISAGVGSARSTGFVDTTIETLRENVIRDAVLMERDPLHTLMLVEHIVAPHIDMRFASRLMLEALASGD